MGLFRVTRSLTNIVDISKSGEFLGHHEAMLIRGPDVVGWIFIEIFNEGQAWEEGAGVFIRSLRLQQFDLLECCKKIPEKGS